MATKLEQLAAECRRFAEKYNYPSTNLAAGFEGFIAHLSCEKRLSSTSLVTGRVRQPRTRGGGGSALASRPRRAGVLVCGRHELCSDAVLRIGEALAFDGDFAAAGFVELRP
jgi:hypothetical protein